MNAIDIRALIQRSLAPIAPEVDLDALGAELAAREDVTVEFLFEPVGSSEHRHMMLRGPSGIRLELRWSPA